MNSSPVGDIFADIKQHIAEGAKQAAASRGDAPSARDYAHLPTNREAPSTSASERMRYHLERQRNALANLCQIDPKITIIIDRSPFQTWERELFQDIVESVVQETGSKKEGQVISISPTQKVETRVIHTSHEAFSQAVKDAVQRLKENDGAVFYGSFLWVQIIQGTFDEKAYEVWIIARNTRLPRTVEIVQTLSGIPLSERRDLPDISDKNRKDVLKESVARLLR